MPEMTKPSMAKFLNALDLPGSQRQRSRRGLSPAAGGQTGFPFTPRETPSKIPLQLAEYLKPSERFLSLEAEPNSPASHSFQP